MTFRLLDLCCKAGGCSVGYYRAGFADITGVDIEPQPNYPFKFIQADALEYLQAHGREYDAIHFSPPCQLFSVSTNSWNSDRSKFADLITPGRPLLVATGKSFVIENVVGAPLNTTLTLCGGHFGLKVWRKRLFECSFFVPALPELTRPRGMFAKQGRIPAIGQFVSVVGGMCQVKLFEYAKRAMGIDWMNRKELAQAIPPAYTEYIGRHWLKYLEASHA